MNIAKVTFSKCTKGQLSPTRGGALFTARRCDRPAAGSDTGHVCRRPDPLRGACSHASGSRLRLCREKQWTMSMPD